MQSKVTKKIIIDANKLEALLRLGCPEKVISDYIFYDKIEKQADNLINTFLESLLDRKTFSNWGGNHNPTGKNQHKNKDLGQVDQQDGGQVGGQVGGQDTAQDVDKDKDIYNNNLNLNNIYKSSFDEFWKEYPKQRAGNKEKAFKAYCKVLKEKRSTEVDLLDAVKKYAISEEVKKGFAKGCQAWLNDDRFNSDYQQPKDEKLVPIEIGKFFLNPYSIDYEQEVKGMSEKQCDRLWQWFIDNFEGQMVSDEYVRKIIRKANKSGEI